MNKTNEYSILKEMINKISNVGKYFILILAFVFGCLFVSEGARVDAAPQIYSSGETGKFEIVFTDPVLNRIKVGYADENLVPKLKVCVSETVQTKRGECSDGIVKIIEGSSPKYTNDSQTLINSYSYSLQFEKDMKGKIYIIDVLHPEKGTSCDTTNIIDQAGYLVDFSGLAVTEVGDILVGYSNFTVNSWKVETYLSDDTSNPFVFKLNGFDSTKDNINAKKLRYNNKLNIKIVFNITYFAGQENHDLIPNAGAIYLGSYNLASDFYEITFEEESGKHVVEKEAATVSNNFMRTVEITYLLKNIKEVQDGDNKSLKGNYNLVFPAETIKINDSNKNSPSNAELTLAVFETKEAVSWDVFNPGNVLGTKGESLVLKNEGSMNRDVYMYKNGISVATEVDENLCLLVDLSSSNCELYSVTDDGNPIGIRTKNGAKSFKIKEVYDDYGNKASDSGVTIQITDVEFGSIKLEELDDDEQGHYYLEGHRYFVDSTQTDPIERRFSITISTKNNEDITSYMESCLYGEGNLCESVEVYTKLTLGIDDFNKEYDISFSYSNNALILEEVETFINLKISVYSYDVSKISLELQNSAPVSTGVGYGKMVNVVYRIVDKNTNKPSEYNYWANESNKSALDKIRYVNYGGISVKYTNVNNNSDGSNIVGDFTLKFTLNDYKFLIYSTRTLSSSVDLINPLGRSQNIELQDLTLNNEDGIIVPYRDSESGSWYVGDETYFCDGSKDGNGNYICNVTIEQPIYGDFVYFRIHQNGSEINSGLRITPGEEPIDDETVKVAYVKNIIDDYNYKFIYNVYNEKSKEAPEITKISGPYLYDGANNTCAGDVITGILTGKAFCYNIEFADTWRFGLNVNVEDFEDLPFAISPRSNVLKVTLNNPKKVIDNSGHEVGTYTYDLERKIITVEINDIEYTISVNDESTDYNKVKDSLGAEVGTYVSETEKIIINGSEYKIRYLGRATLVFDYVENTKKEVTTVNLGMYNKIVANTTDISGRVAVWTESPTPNEGSLTLIPEELKYKSVILNDPVKIDIYGNSYYKTLILLLEFNRDIREFESAELYRYVDGVESSLVGSTCESEIVLGKIKCTLTGNYGSMSIYFRATGVIDEHGGNIGTDVQLVSAFNKIIIDNTAPTIEFVTTSGNYNKDAEFNLSFKLSGDIDEDSLDLSKISVNVSGQQKCNSSSEYTLTKKSGEYVLVIPVTGCTGTGDLTYSVSEGLVKDYAGNVSAEIVSSDTGIDINNDALDFASTVSQTKKYISATSSNNSKEVTFVMNKEIRSCNHNLISLVGDIDARVIGCKVDENTKTNIIITITASKNNTGNYLNGDIKLNFAEGSIVDIYGNGISETTNKDTDAEVLSGNFEIALKFDAINSSGCLLVDGEYYCNESDDIVISGNPNRTLTDGENTSSEVAYNVGLVSKTNLTGNYNSDSGVFGVFTFTYIVADGDNGLFKINISSSILTGYTDNAGNTGKFVIDDEILTKINIDTIDPSFNSNTVYEVDLGSAYNESDIISYFSNGVVNKDEYTYEHVKEDEVSDIYNPAGDCEWTLKATDKAGNTATKSIIVRVVQKTAVSVKIQDTTVSYGTAYEGGQIKYSIEIPSSLNEVVDESSIKTALSELILVDGSKPTGTYEVGTYTIDINGREVNGIDISVTTGKYIVKQATINVSNLTFTVSKTYDGSVNIASDKVTITGDNNNFVVATGEFHSKAAGSVGYTLNLTVTNNNYVLSTYVVTGTGTITQATLDLGDIIDNVEKYFDGTLNVLQSSFDYTTSQGDSLTIKWTSGSYANADACKSGDQDTTCSVTLGGVTAEGANKANYSIASSVTVTGKLKVDSGDLKVAYDSSGTIYANANKKSITIGISDYNDAASKQYEDLGMESKAVYTSIWCAYEGEPETGKEYDCGSPVTTDTFTYTIDSSITGSAVFYVYSKVTNKSGNYDEKMFTIIYNDNFSINKIGLVTVDSTSKDWIYSNATDTTTYGIGETIYVGIQLTSLIDTDDVESTYLIMVNELNDEYRFSFVDYFGDSAMSLVYKYTVSKDSKEADELLISSIEGFDLLKDDFENKFNMPSNLAELQTTAKISIDTSAGILNSVEFSATGVTPVSGDYYINAKIDKTINVVLTFNSEIKTPITTVKVGDVFLTCTLNSSATDESKNKVITCTTSAFTSTTEGKVAIKYFGTVEGVGNTIGFENGSVLKLDSAYVSNVLPEKLANSLYVDNTDLEVTFDPEEQTVYQKGYVELLFNKEYVDSSNVCPEENVGGCKSLFTIKEGEITLTDTSNITINYDGNGFEIIYAGTDNKTYEFVLNVNKIKDYVGNFAASKSFTITFDNVALSSNIPEITAEGDNCNYTTNEDSEIVRKCGKNTTITVLVPFNRKIVVVNSAVLNYAFNESPKQTEEYKLIDGNIVFTVKVDDLVSTEDGVFSLGDVVYDVIDERGVALSNTVDNELLLTNITLDTTGLTLNKIGNDYGGYVSGFEATSSSAKAGFIEFYYTLGAGYHLENNYKITVVDFSKQTEYVHARVHSVEITANNELRVVVKVEESASSGDNIKVKLFKGDILDDVNNVIEGDDEYWYSEFVTIDNTKPIVSASLKSREDGTYQTAYQPGETISIQLSFNDGTYESGKKVCIVHETQGEIACTSTIGEGNVVTFKVDESVKDGSYRVSIEKGFLKDGVGNESEAYLSSSVLFTVGSSKARAEITTVDFDKVYSDESIRYAFFDSASDSVKIKLTAVNGEFASNICSFVVLRKGSNEVKAGDETYACSANSSNEVTITNIGLEEGEYYIVLKENLVTNDYGMDSEEATTEKSYLIEVYSGTLTGSVAKQEGTALGNSGVYYVNNSSTLTLRFTMDRYIARRNGVEENTKTETYDYVVSISGLVEGKNDLTMTITDHLGNSKQISYVIYKDIKGPEIEGSFTYTYGSRVTAETKTLEYEISDDYVGTVTLNDSYRYSDLSCSAGNETGGYLKLGTGCYEYTYSGGKLTLKVPVSDSSINIELPKGLFKDGLANESEKKIISINVQDAVFVIESTDYKVGTTYYTTDGNVHFTLKALTGSIKSVVYTDATNQICGAFKLGTSETLTNVKCTLNGTTVNVEGSISASGTVSFATGAFKVKLVNDTEEYESGSTSFTYVYDDDAPIYSSVTVNGSATTAEQFYKKDDGIKVVYTFSEELREAPVLNVAYGDGTNESSIKGIATYTGTLVNNGSSTTVTYTFNAGSAEGFLYIKLGTYKDIAGNETLTETNYTITKTTIDNTKPTVSVALDGTDIYYAEGETVTFIVTVSGGSVVSGKQLCLYNALTNTWIASTCESATSGKVSFTIDANVVDGQYKVYVEEGYVEDSTGNKSEAYVEDSVLIYVSSDAAGVIIRNVSGFDVSFAGSVVKYAYFASTSHQVQFDLEAVNGEFVSDICNFIVLHDGNSEIIGGFNCSVNNTRVTITNVSLQGTYYVVIEEGIVTNDYGKKSSSITTEDSYMIEAYKDDGFGGKMNATTNTGVFKDGKYYVDEGDTLEFEFVMKRDIASFSSNGVVIPMDTKKDYYDEYDVKVVNLKEGSNSIDFVLKDYLGNEKKFNIIVVKDNNAPVITPDSDNKYVFSSSSTLVTKTLKFNVTDATEITFRSLTGASYDSDTGVLTVNVLISNTAKTVELPEGLFVDILGHESEARIISLSVQNAAFIIESTDYNEGDTYYTTDGKVHFTLKGASETIENHTVCPTGYSCNLIQNVVHVEGTISESKTVIFDIGAFKVKLMNDDEIYESGKAEFKYVYDKDKATHGNNIAINGTAYNTKRLYKGGQTLSIVYTFNEPLKKAPVLNVAYGVSSNPTDLVSITNGRLVNNGTSTKVTYEINASNTVFDTTAYILLKLGDVEDIAGNITLAEDNYTETKHEVDNKIPTILSVVASATGFVKVGDSISFEITVSEGVTFNDLSLTNANTVLDNVTRGNCSTANDSCLKISGEVKSGFDGFALTVKPGFVSDSVGNINTSGLTSDEIKVLVIKDINVTTENCSGIYCGSNDKIVVEVRYNHELEINSSDKVITNLSDVELDVVSTFASNIHKFSYTVSSIEGEITSLRLVTSNFGQDIVYGGKIVLDVSGVGAPNISRSGETVGINKNVVFTVSFDDEEGLKLIDTWANNLQVTIGSVPVVFTKDMTMICDGSTCSFSVYVNSGNTGGDMVLTVNEVVEDRAGNRNTSGTSTIVVDGTTIGIDNVTVDTSNDVQADGYEYVKSGDTITVVVTFNSAVSGDLPALVVEFDGLEGRGVVSSSLDSSKTVATYVYKVDRLDRGALSNLELKEGSLSNDLGNPVNLVISSYNNKVLVDNTDYVITLTPRETTVSGSVIFDYTCKEYSACTLTDDDLEVLVNGTVDGVITVDGKVITISSLTLSGSMNVSLKEDHSVSDYAGHLATLVISDVVMVDNSKLSVVDVDVRGSGNNCVGNQCSKDGTIAVTLIFNKNIVSYPETLVLNAKIGNTEIVMNIDKLNSTGKYLAFTYTVPENVEGKLVLIRLSSLEIVDELNNKLDSVNISDSINSLVNFNVDATGPIVNSVTIVSACDNDVCNEGDKIKFTYVFDEKVSAYSINVVTNFGTLNIENVTLTIPRSVIVLEMTISNASGAGQLTITSISGSYKDSIGNISTYANEGDYSSIEMDTILVDNDDPVIGYIELPGNDGNGSYSASGSTTVTLNITENSEFEYDLNNLCLKNLTINSLKCNVSEVTFDEDTKELTIDLSALSGSYAIVLKSGFVVDAASNMSAEVVSSTFNVSNDKDNVIVSNVTNTAGTVTANNIDYYYFGISSDLRFDISVIDDSRNQTEYVGVDACNYISFYKYDGDVKVSDVFTCAIDSTRDVKIYLRNDVNLEEVANNKYYFIIDGSIMKNKNGNDSNNYDSKDIITLIVNPSALVESERTFSTNDIVIKELADSTKVYVIKGVNSLDVTFSFNADIKEYSFGSGFATNTTSNLGEGTKSVKIRGLMEGAVYSLVFTDYLGNTIETKVEVYKDNTKPVIEVSHEHVNNYIGDNNINLTFTCSDTGDNGSEGSSSLVDCSSRVINVYRNDTLLNDYTNSQSENSNVITLVNIRDEDVFRVEYSVRDGLGNETVKSEEFTVDTIKPDIGVSINKNPVKSSELEVTVRVVEAGSGLVSKVIEYSFVNQNDSSIKYSGTVTLDDNNEATISGNAITVDGDYRLVIKSISDNVNNSSEEYSSVVIDVDNTSASLVGGYGEGCNDVDGTLYCGKGNVIKFTVEYNEPINKIVSIVSSWATIRDISINEENNKIIDLVVVVNNDALNSDNLHFELKLEDMAGNINDASETEYVVICHGIIVDTTDDFSELEVVLDNEYGKNPTYISDVIVTHDSEYAPIRDIKYVLDGEEYTLDELKLVEIKQTSELVVTVTDYSGNSGVKTFEIVVDSVAPTFSVVMKDNETTLTNYTFNKNIKVEITTSDSDVEFYCVSTSECAPTSEWNDGNIEFVLTEGEETVKQTVYIYLVDKAGNVSKLFSKEITFVNPVLVNNNGEEDAWYNNYNITVNGLINGLKVEYGLLLEDESIFDQAYTKSNSSSGSTMNLKGNMDGQNGIFKFITKIYSTSNTEYVKLKDISGLNIDTELEFDGVPVYSKDWTNDSVEVSLAVSEEEVSGVASAQVYKKNEGIYEPDNSVVCSVSGLNVTCDIYENGDYQVKVIDNAGNAKATGRGTVVISNIDRIGYNANIEYAYGVNEDTWLKEHSMSLSFIGNGASKVEILYLLIADRGVNASNFKDVLSANFASNINGSVDASLNNANIVLSGRSGEFVLYVYVLDQAGNVTVNNAIIRLDNEKPNINVDSDLFVEEYRQISQQDVEGVVTIVDNHVGTIKDVVYTYIDVNDEALRYSDISKLEGKYKLEIVARDTLGNESKYVSDNVVWIDNVGPTVTRTNEKEAHVVPNYIVSDSVTGIDMSTVKYCYTILEQCSVSDWRSANLEQFDIEIPVSEATYNLFINVSDNAGNESVYKEVISYDSKVPEITYSVDGFEASEISEVSNIVTFDKLVNNDIYITLDINDLSGIKCSYVVYTSGDSIIGKAGYDGCDGNTLEYEGVTKYSPTKVNGKYRISADLASKTTIYVNVFAKDNAGNISTKVFIVDNINNVGVEFNPALSTNDPSTSVNIGLNVKGYDNADVLATADIKVAYKVITEYDDSIFSNYNSKQMYNDVASDIEEMKLESLTLSVIANGLYVFKVVDKWGNETYKNAKVVNIDRELPVLGDVSLVAKDTDKAFIDLVDTYEEVIDRVIKSNDRYIYNGGLKLKITNLNDAGPAKVFLTLCYDESECVDIPLSNDVINEIPLREKYSGNVRYSLKDEAGNVSAGSVNFGLEYLGDNSLRDDSLESVVTSVGVNNQKVGTLSSEGYYNDLSIQFTVTDLTRRYDAIKYYLVKDEVSYCESDWMQSKGGTYEATCLNDLDGTYSVVYELRDILGNVNDGFVVENVMIDTKVPVNQKDMVSFKLVRNEDSTYSLKYKVDTEVLQSTDVRKITIWYDETVSVCSINTFTSEWVVCEGTIDSYFDVNNTFKFGTRLVDKADNVSNLVAADPLTYNESRNVELSYKYEPNSKKVTIIVNVANAVGNVTSVKVFANGGSTELVDLTSDSKYIDSVNKKYHLDISASTYASLFADGVINASFTAEVHDSYTSEGEENTEVPSDDVVTVNIDTKDITITYGSISPIVTLNGNNSFTIYSNKPLITNSANPTKNARYILRRNVSLIGATVSNFDKLYNECANQDYCVRGELKDNEDGSYTFIVEQNAKLISDDYQLDIYGEDVAGHKRVDVEKVIYIDNTAPVIEPNKTPVATDVIVVDGQEHVVKVYNSEAGVEITVRDDNSDYYSGLGSVNLYKITESGNELKKYLLETEKGQGSYYIGVVGSYGDDGYYYIETTDIVGNKSIQYILVDSSNSGVDLIFDGELVKVERGYNRESLKKLSFRLNEDMRTISFEFDTSVTNSIISISLDVSGTATVARKTDSGLVKTSVSHSYSLKQGELIDIQSLLNDMLGSGVIDNLSSEIVQLRVIVMNKSAIRVSRSILIDFVAPVINVNSGVKYNNQGKIVEEGYNSYSLVVDVITSGDADEVASALQSIVRLFIKNVDGKYYDTDEVKSALTISINEKLSFKADVTDWTAYNILDVVGIYNLKFSYMDSAGNSASDVYLKLDVRDNVAPELRLNDSSVKDEFYLNISSSGPATYTDKGATTTDNYGFDEKGTTKTVSEYKLTYTIDGASVELVDDKLIVGGVVYASKSGNTYTFYKQALYAFTYAVSDFSKNEDSRTIYINVRDKHAPSITDTNKIQIIEELGLRKFEINGREYTIIEESGVIVEIVDTEENYIDVSENKFMLNGIEYLINATYVMMAGININTNKICFYDDENCKITLNPLEAYDDEDASSLQIVVSEVKYSKYGDVWNTADYVLEESEGLFKLKSIVFNTVGYYRIVFKTIDSNGNVDELKYEFRIFDIDKPVYVIDGNEYLNGSIYTKTIEFDQEFIDEYKNLQYKIKTWIINWINDNVTVKHNYKGDENIKYTIGNVEELSNDISMKEYLKYSVVLSTRDSSLNKSELTIIVSILDLLPPENGNIKFSYSENMNNEIDLVGISEIKTNEQYLYFTLDGASDLTGLYTYEYMIEMDGYNITNDYVVYDGGAIRAYIYANGYSSSIRVKYRVRDAVGNVSEEKISPIFVFDNSMPGVTLISQEMIDEQLVETQLENGSVYKGEGTLKITFYDDGGYTKVIKYVNNTYKYELDVYNESMLSDTEFGHYKYVVIDRAGNEVSLEYVILPSDKTYTLIDNKSLANSGNALSEDIVFDDIVLQKLYDDGNRFYFEDMSLVGNNDKVYLMGIVPDRDGATFSIFASGALNGSLFRQYTSYFPVNTSSNITNINPEYELSDYLINLKGDKYILVGIVYGAGGSSSEEDSGSEDTKENDKKEAANMTWILYVLGAAGAVGGGFLIIKLRKRVRAA